MTFKIGDKVLIHDGSFSVKLTGGTYNKYGVHGVDKVEGTVKAVGCRLPILGCYYESVCPTMGIKLYGGGVIYNDLLVQTEDGFAFTSTRHVRLAEPEPVKLVLCGVEIGITEQQYNDLEARGFFHRHSFIKGV